ncbi:MAG: PIN domain-containing protein [Coriobacteriia bacterium]
MSAGALIDTNVLVYALDTDEATKCERARTVLRRLEAMGVGAVSSQVLGEHFSVVARRFAHSIGVEQAVSVTESWAEVFVVHDTTLTVVLEALRGVVRYKMSYYDAQIWAVARVNQIPLVLSEDFSDGAVIEGVRFANPFARGFDLEVVLV